MKEDQEQRFICCKVCTKPFTNWRCLGGHMRGHVTQKTEDSCFGQSGFDYFQDCGDFSYGLRENPKKTWRVSVSDAEQSTDGGENTGLVRCCSKREKEEHNCKQCGKGFNSIRALFGHMRHHSSKRSRVLIQSEISQSGFEILGPTKKKRSKTRYGVSGFRSVSNFSSLLKISEFSGEEEAALGLVMLSSGFTNWADFVSDFDSFENDSLISKAQALNRNELNLDMKLNSSVSEFGDFETKFSGFGNGKESEQIRVEWGNKNVSGLAQHGSEIKSGETSFGDQDSELGVRLNSSVSKSGDLDPRTEFKKPVVGDDFQIVISDSEICKGNNIRTTEETSFDDQDAGFGRTGFVGVENDDSVSKISETCENKPEFNCKTGGNQATKCEEKSDKMEITYERKKRKYFHECPICFKVFPSGQALGGHKRAHFNGFSENKNKTTQESAAGVTDFGIEKQFNSGLGLRSWCATSPVVISN